MCCDDALFIDSEKEGGSSKRWPRCWHQYGWNRIKKRFPEKNFILVNRDFPKMINLEKIISNFNIKRYFTSPSSSIFLTKVLKSKISIYDYGSYWRNFLKNNWSLFKHKNNFNNYLVASKLYRNISNKL